MAVSKRCIPTRFFKDPDIVDLSKDTQLILIGLVLNADDEGREYAHAKVLGQEMSYPPEHIETALQELATHHLIVLYQVGRHRYYQLTKQWQNLGAKATPSKFPAPQVFQENAELSVKTTVVSRKSSAQEKRREENSRESNAGEEETKARPANVIPLPTSHGGGGGEDVLDGKRVEHITHQVATILKLPVTAALRRVVADFLGVATLSLPGEADAAREYIDDPQRNHRRKTMSPAFYRGWLKRERDHPRAPNASLDPSAPVPRATSASLPHPPAGLASRSLMGLEEEYQRTDKHQQKGNL